MPPAGASSSSVSWFEDFLRQLACTLQLMANDANDANDANRGVRERRDYRSSNARAQNPPFSLDP